MSAAHVALFILETVTLCTNIDKLKSERINRLRKQYDAFLEEDKKRKERNEFILGRLDKMRYYSTALQLRYKPNTLISRHIPHSRVAYNLEHPVKNQDELTRINRPVIALEVPKNHIDETILLKELSNKFILIPKLSTTISSDYENNTKQDTNFEQIIEDNSDWKSKYDILDKLKKKDKEEYIDNPTHKENYGLKTNDVPEVYGKTHKNEIKTNDHTNEDRTLKYRLEIPEKDIIEIKDNFELPNVGKCDTTNDSYHKIHPVNTVNPSYDTTQFNAKVESEMGQKMQNLDLNDHQQSDNNLNLKSYGKVENTYSEAINADTPYSETELYSEQKVHESYDNPNSPTEYPSAVETNDQSVPLVEENEKNLDIANISYFNEDKTLVAEIAPDDLVKEISHEIKSDTTNEFPVEIINTQDFTPNEAVKLEDSVNINSVGVDLLNQAPINLTDHPEAVSDNVVIQEHTENTVDATDIEAFDTEQREMFYSEQQEVYDPNADNVYQAGGYNQNENFQQDEQYAYYQSQLEQSYPIEINEHEEASQKYDPSYEKQYGYEEDGYAQQDESQQLVYDQQQLEHNPEQENNYDQIQQEYNPLQYEQEHYEPETQIEQQLDNEQGYIEKQNEELTEIEKPAQMKTEQVADTTTS
ncbi:hypothetical protein K1T71_010773 [Dendrolimus kikuchii]|uniref:Uncharacterized protein n=1 Tax=Dendrolimus kikuchii TaxID=765133 RepID=A0ACC1CPT0_9NEOP|nr:hypothetical protein K1T71_010773 [Dendrolimus kikuchii]